jgi:hypothetical protein
MCELGVELEGTGWKNTGWKNTGWKNTKAAVPIRVRGLRKSR